MQKNRTPNYNYQNHLSDSQNFLTDRRLIRRITRLARLAKTDTVLEIGTGKGHLTEALCRESGSVYSVEIDRKLFDYAGSKLSHLNNLKLVFGDFLKYPLPQKGDYKVFANIPFFITSQIVEKLTQTPNPPEDIWLIMEKGAAMRFLGLPRESAKSLLLKTGWDMEILYYFCREDFHPMPHTSPVLVHFSRKEKPDLMRRDFPSYRKFIRYSMKYGIWGRQGLLTKRQAFAALKQAGLPPAHEDGVTLYIQWLCLFRCWRRIHKQ